LANNDERLHVINYKTQSQSPPIGRRSRLILDFEEEIKKVTDGVDHIIEFIGKSYWTQNLNVLRRDGVMVYLAFMSGAGFPEDASIAQVRHTFFLHQYTVALAGS
jgi:NADPH:quinone reductase-like Zn-dependent oxidoreductase